MSAGAWCASSTRRPEPSRHPPAGPPSRPRASVRPSLRKELPDLIGPDDQFFFYATDHGSWYVEDTQARQVQAGTPGEFDFGLTRETYAAAWADEGNLPAVSIDYAGLAEAASVYLNDVLLGILPPVSGAFTAAPATAVMPVSESMLLLDNLLRIEPASTPFTVTNIAFDLGAIGRDMVVGIAEPAPLGLVAVAGLSMRAARRLRPGRLPRRG